MLKKYPLLSFAVLFILMGISPAYADTSEPHKSVPPLLTWRDLIPKHVLSADPLNQLTLDQRSNLWWIIDDQPNAINSEFDITTDLVGEIVEQLPELERSNINIEALIQSIIRVRTALDAQLDGQQIKIAGYIVPLEMSGQNVTDFLLVPYVGACIHVPPPPPNQMIFVKKPKGFKIKNQEQFIPVMVNGIISAKSTVKNTFIKDGSMDLDIGYSMEAISVEPHKEE